MQASGRRPAFFSRGGLPKLSGARRLTAISQSEYRALRDLKQTDPAIRLDPFNSLVAASQYRYLYWTTREMLSTPSRVLDWGCGEGHFSHFLLREGHLVTAYTLQHEPPLFHHMPADWLDRLDFVRGDSFAATALPFDAEAFDAVFSVGVLEHVREGGGSELGSLRELRRTPRPGGHVVCFHLPNRFSYIEALSRLRYRPGQRVETSGTDNYHLFRFSRRKIRALFESAGFEIMFSGRYGILPRNSAGKMFGQGADSPAVATTFNLADAVLETVFSGIAQNHMIVAKRPP